MTNDLKAPFPYFGGKSGAANLVWRALGDVENYIEPFAGSLAVLLGRPSDPLVETVNDLDGLLCNAWRALQFDPEGTAWAADWPVSELDLCARHMWLVEHKDEITKKLASDPEWFDPKAAGWWIWGACCWIGSGWCKGTGAWSRGEDGLLVKGAKTEDDPSITQQLPYLRDDGRGVNKPSITRQLPHLSENRGVNKPSITKKLPHLHESARGIQTSHALEAWFLRLSARLRGVRVACGDWSRVLTQSVSTGHLAVRDGGFCGVFLDPPYGDVRTKDVYANDSVTVAQDVRKWCLENGEHPAFRIVLAGYAGEGHEVLEAQGWAVHEWYREGFLTGGYAKQGKDGTQQHLERLWCSPNCQKLEADPETSSINNLLGLSDE